MRSLVVKVVSGGQTGADRGGLDAAISLGIPHGGWCPKGRLAEDGGIPSKYGLVETRSRSYLARTEQNVVDSHLTLIFTHGQPSGGSKRTVDFAVKHCRPWLHADLDQQDDKAIARGILEWLSGGGLECPSVPTPPANPVVNVAGSRESKAPGIQERVAKIMTLVLNWPEYPPHGE
jgi:hypothetical protein